MLKNSRMADRMPSIYQKYLSKLGPEWAENWPPHRPHTDGSGVKPIKDEQTITTLGLPNSYPFLCTQRKI